MGAASSQVGTLPPSDTPAYLWDTQRLTKLLVLLFLIFFSSPFTFVVLPPTNSIGLDSSSSSFSVIIWRRGSWVGTCGWARFLLRDRRHDFFFFFFFFYCISMNGHRSTERISYSGFPLLGGPADSLPSASSIVSDGTAVTLSTPSAEDHIETCAIIQCRRRWDISAGIIAVFPGGEEKKSDNKTFLAPLVDDHRFEKKKKNFGGDRSIGQVLPSLFLLLLIRFSLSSHLPPPWCLFLSVSLIKTHSFLLK